MLGKMATRPLNAESLRYDRQRLSDLVLDPLQHVKLAFGRNLTGREVAQIKIHLEREVRSDILLADGEDLIIILDQYYGLDNIRVLERLLSQIQCHDLLNALLDWKERNNPIKPEIFYGKLRLRFLCFVYF